MADILTRGTLSGVNEFVTFLEAASTNDRSAFSKKANVIIECRICATLFRKPDGFMRHAVRCGTNRSEDVDLEPDKLNDITKGVTSPKASRMVPLTKPLTNGMAPAASTQAKAPAASTQIKAPAVNTQSTVKQKDFNVKKPSVKMEIVTTPPRVERESESAMKASSSTRAQKRANNRITAQKVIPEKIRKTDIGNGSEVAASVSPKSTKSSEVKLQDLNAEIRPSRMRKTPKWLKDSFFVI